MHAISVIYSLLLKRKISVIIILVFDLKKKSKLVGYSYLVGDVNMLYYYFYTSKHALFDLDMPNQLK